MSNVFLAFSLLAICAAWAQDFSYVGIYGPQYWGEKYHTCVGKHQSPINIDEHKVRSVALRPLVFSGLDKPKIATLTNNGHTALFKVLQEGSNDVLISGGPLGEVVYAFEQLHFHWGENDREGSEDKINNQSYAMELHAVFYKLVYGSMAEATKYSDGLAVLAYFLEAGEEADKNYEPLVETLLSIENIGTEKKISESIRLESILLTNRPSIQSYFTYNGSLTTPPCSEVVIWIDFKEPHKLSREQIAAFRRLRSAEGKRVTHNFRPVQPLEDRIVYENVPEVNHHHKHTHSNHHHHPTEYSSAQFTSRISVSLVIISLFIIFLRVK